MNRQFEDMKTEVAVMRKECEEHRLYIESLEKKII